MARHSHWAQIKLKKGALDKKRGKIFTRHAHLIEVAARTAGGDPLTNANLRVEIENARAENMPRENIDRAIKKGTGELKSEQQMFEITYEGYGPGGVALMIETLTNNKNRTGQMVRTTLEKFGGNLGETGSTGFMFETKGEITVKKKGDKDSDELELIDSGAQDLEETEEGFLVYTHPAELGAVRKKINEKGFSVVSATLIKAPKIIVSIADIELAKKVLKLIDTLDDEDDILNVYVNFDMTEDVMNGASE